MLSEWLNQNSLSDSVQDVRIYPQHCSILDVLDTMAIQFIVVNESEISNYHLHTIKRLYISTFFKHGDNCAQYIRWCFYFVTQFNLIFSNNNGKYRPSQHSSATWIDSYSHAVETKWIANSYIIRHWLLCWIWHFTYSWLWWEESIHLHHLQMITTLYYRTSKMRSRFLLWMQFTCKRISRPHTKKFWKCHKKEIKLRAHWRYVV